MPLKDGRKKKRDMDNFLEQLKREQAEREERLKSRAEQGQPAGSVLGAKFETPADRTCPDQVDHLSLRLHVRLRIGRVDHRLGCSTV